MFLFRGTHIDCLEQARGSFMCVKVNNKAKEIMFPSCYARKHLVQTFPLGERSRHKIHKDFVTAFKILTHYKRKQIWKLSLLSMHENT